MPLPDRQSIIDYARALGFHTVGCAKAVPVSPAEDECRRQFLAEGRHAGMDYLAKYPDIRRDPRLLLERAQSVIVCAMSYYHNVPDNAPAIAMYAHGTDYHIILRDRLEQLAQYIRENFGGQTRVCVDTAPLAERYWAVKAGLGFIGVNSQLIIPGAGSYFFIGSIITTTEFVADTPLNQHCCHCRRCATACPGGAIRSDGTFDARRCLSYLTIEHRGPFPDGTRLSGHLYGCDECQRVCPHNLCPPVTPIDEFNLRPAYLDLTPARAASLTQEEFSTLFRHSAIKRTHLAGLHRNALQILADPHSNNPSDHNDSQ